MTVPTPDYSSSANWTTLVVRNFLGKAISLEADLNGRVSRFKDLLRHTTISSCIPHYAHLRVSFNGHELRNHRRLDFYGITKDSVVHILPPSSDKKLRLSCHSLASTFTIEVDETRTVEQLKKEIQIEEGITSMDCIEYYLDEDSQPRPLAPESSQLNSFPLDDANLTLFLRPPPSPIPPPSSFRLTIQLNRYDMRVSIEARPQETIEEFRSSVKRQCGVSVRTDVLVLVGKEIIGEGLTVWEHGFAPGCTVHAVPYVSFTVELTGVKTFEPMKLHPLTRLSKVRKALKRQQRHDTTGGTSISLHQYVFSLDGRAHLPESGTLWDMNVVSGSTLYLRPSTISVTLKVDKEPPMEIDVELDETIDELLERWELVSERDPLPREAKIYYREKPLKRSATVREEGITGGDVLKCISCPWVPANAS